MTNLMLDTSGYAAFMRGNLEAVELMQKAEVILLPVIVLGELFAGFESGQRDRDCRHAAFGNVFKPTGR